MNLKTFRESGELSDITVVIGDTEFKLHQFALFTKSQYIYAFVRDNPGSIRLDLKNFPVAAATFSIVADFCYNVTIDLTKHNVVELKSAADFLQMPGEDNLSAVCDKFLGDCLTTAKLSRSVDLISTLMVHCARTGDKADETGMLTLCIQALVDCWLKPSTKFTAPSKFRGSVSRDDSESEQICTKNICSLPRKWFCRLLSTTREQGVGEAHRCRLASAYIDEALSNASDVSISEEKDTTSEGKATASEGSTECQSHDATSSCLDEVIDDVMTALGKPQSLAQHVTVNWLCDVLNRTSESCQSRQYLLSAAVDAVRRMPKDDLAHLTPSDMALITQHMYQTDAVDEVEKVAGLSGEFVNSYMQLLADRGELTPELFCKLAQSVPSHLRHDHDRLFGIMQKLIETGDKKSTEEEQAAMMAVIDFQLLTEASLETSLSRGLLPMSLVAKTALSLCGKLRAELAGVHPKKYAVLNDRPTDVTSSSHEKISSAPAFHGRVGSSDTHVATLPASSHKLTSRLFLDSYSNHRPHARHTAPSISPRQRRLYALDSHGSRAKPAPLANHSRRTFGVHQSDDGVDIGDELVDHYDINGDSDPYGVYEYERYGRHRSFRDSGYYH